MAVLRKEHKDLHKYEDEKMKKIVSILLISVASFGFAFAATDATLNLTTTVPNVLESLLVKGTTAPDLDSFVTSNTAVTQTLGTGTGEYLSANFVYAYKTNLTAAPTVTVKADRLKTSDATPLVLKYSVTPAGGTAIPVTSDATLIALGMSDSTPTTGLRVIAKGFAVSIADTDFTAAAAGTYTATITFLVAAS